MANKKPQMPTDLDLGPPPELAKRFLYFRKIHLKFTQLQLAEAVGIYQSTINTYEKATRHITTEVVMALHKKFQMSYNWFFNGEGEPTLSTSNNRTDIDLNEIKETNYVLFHKITAMEKQLIALTRELMALKHKDE